jgi:hypothetical protein
MRVHARDRSVRVRTGELELDVAVQLLDRVRQAIGSASLPHLVVERRQDPRRQLRRAPTVDELEQRVDVIPTVAGETLGERLTESSAAQQLDAPGRDLPASSLWVDVSRQTHSNHFASSPRRSLRRGGWSDRGDSWCGECRAGALGDLAYGDRRAGVVERAGDAVAEQKRRQRDGTDGRVMGSPEVARQAHQRPRGVQHSGPIDRDRWSPRSLSARRIVDGRGQAS